MKTKLSHPVSAQDVLLRNALLQGSLRQEFPNAGPIELEYPLVLHNADARFSYCLWSENGDLIGHLNCWPRCFHMPDGTRRTIGVIGNVAIEPIFRARGLMKKMFLEIEKIKEIKDFDALILWTDEPLYYHSLGFREFGSELRIVFNRDSQRSESNLFAAEDPDALTSEEIQHLIDLRPQGVLVPERTVEEMRSLLQIPDCILLTCRDDSDVITESMIVGRGCDFIGTVHEWVAESPERFYEGLQQVLRLTQWDNLQCIAPTGAISDSSLAYLFQNAHSVESMPMAFGKFKNSQILSDFKSCFFWGLDSI